MLKSTLTLRHISEYVKNNKFEQIFSGIAGMVIWIVLAVKGGGPIYSDEQMYVNIGLNNIQNPSYGNRYFHVYLQKLFMSLAPNPVTGTKIFWGFLIALTVFLVYWNARSLFKHSQPIHGLLAVIIFFSFGFISRYCGVTSVDITAMMMVTVTLSIYLFYLHSGREQRWALVALGALIFFSFKTKESTLFANVILIGLLFNQDGKFSFTNIAGLIKPFLMGFFSAVGVFIFLDTIFLHNPLFSINPQTIASVFENYAYTGEFRIEPTSYFTTFLLADIMAPFLLYLISGVTHYGKDESPSVKIVWLFPLVLALFMTLNMLKIPWGFIERFYFPALPVIAILAPQWLRFEMPKSIRKKVIMAGLSMTGIGLILLFHQNFMAWTENIKWDYGQFVDSIYHPILLFLLLGFVLIVRRMNWLNILLPVTLILALLMAPLLYNEKYIFRIPYATNYFNQEFAPFIAFQDQIHYADKMTMFFSSNIQTEANSLSYNRDELVAMFNIFFNGRTSRSNFYLGYKPDTMGEAITTQSFDYVMLSTNDWSLISSNLVWEKVIQSKYNSYSDPAVKVILLVKK
jgi:hypothetical protein